MQKNKTRESVLIVAWWAESNILQTAEKVSYGFEPCKM